MPDFIEPAIGLPLAGILTLAWWLIERHHAHKLGAERLGPFLGSAHAPASTGQPSPPRMKEHDHER